MFVRERKVIQMKNQILFLYTLLFALANNTVRATNDHDKAKIKAIAKQAEDCFAGRLVGTALTYSMVGLGFQGLGYGLQNIPGVVAPQHDQIYFGQLVTVIPNTEKASSTFKKRLSSAAYRSYQFGSLAHWPLRSVKDFGLIALLAYKSHFFNVRKMGKQMVCRVVPGIVALTVPVFMQQAWEKSYNEKVI
jgi:hypothetical protein